MILKSTNITASGLDNNYKISFYPIGVSDVSYYIKAFYKDGFINGEDMDTIAISESPGKYIQIFKPDYKNVEQLSYELKTDKEVKYIKIMARLNDDQDKEFYLYTPIEVKNEYTEKNEESESSNNTAIIVSIIVVIILAAVSVGVGIWVFIYKKRKKDILEQVNKISFSQSDAKEKEENDNNNLLPDDLLINDDENSNI